MLEVLREKGLTQAELARRMGRPLQPVNEIVKGKKAITAATAPRMEAALAISAHIWTGLEAEYRLALARNARAPARAASKRKAAARVNTRPRAPPCPYLQ